MYGISWGGRTTLYQAAIDTRLAAVAVSGYFNQTTKKQFQPSTCSTAYIDTPEEYASFHRFSTEFWDADLASLVAPRPVFIESGTLDTAAYLKDSFIEPCGLCEFSDDARARSARSLQFRQPFRSAYRRNRNKL